MVCKKLQDSKLAVECIKYMTPWAMGQHFNVRLYAQISIFHIIKDFRLHGQFGYLWEAVQESLKQGTSEQNFKKLHGDFRFNFLDYSNMLSVENIIFHIPRITNMVSDELYWNLSQYFPLPNFNEMRNAEKMPVAAAKHQDDEGFIVGDVQRKMNPSKLNLETEFIFYSDREENSEKDMMVVASLITKLPNLGGIARTCEVLGIKNLVINSLKHSESKEFKTLSMTAEKWLRISEVKLSNLKNFLLEKQLEGYSVVGAEQTANSVNFVKFNFPKRSILLLGHEKEGIPANLISLLDFAVEIPQFGMVRSLNVHVTGALFMWEYCKQHLMEESSKEEVI